MPNEKIIYLTGCTAGLGEALTRTFAQLGCLVVGFGRDLDALRRLRSELGSRHHLVRLDVGEETDVEAVLPECISSHGTPDLLVNNAATNTSASELWEVDAGEFVRVLNVNVFGTLRFIRRVLPQMVARRSGVVVNMSSRLGRRGAAGFGAYATSKWAVEGLTASMACDLAACQAGVAALTLDPGPVNTRLLREAVPEIANDFCSADEWAAWAAPALLSLNVSHNGRVLGPEDLRSVGSAESASEAKAEEP